MTPEEQKRRSERRQAYTRFLDERIPTLHKEGYKGRAARERADYLWAKEQK